MSLTVTNSNLFIQQFENATRPREITEQHWLQIQNYIENNPSEFEIKNDFRKIKRNENLPLSLLISNCDGFKLVIFFKGKSREIGEGGNRVAKQAYYLSNNSYVVYKKPYPIERKLAKVLPKHPGLIETHWICKYKGKNGQYKTRMFEKRYDGTLYPFYSESMKTKQLHKIFIQLLEALKAFHETELKGIPCRHYDIKLGNVFYTLNKKGEIIKVVLGDYDAACQTISADGTFQYFSPEFARLALKINKFKEEEKAFENRNKTTEEDRQSFEQKKDEFLEEQRTFHKNFGAAVDLWALGYLFANLPCSMKEPALPCLADRFYRSSNKNKLLKRIANISQEKIDHDLNKLCKRVKNPERLKLWTIIKGLLRVDPSERMSIEHAIEILK